MSLRAIHWLMAAGFVVTLALPLSAQPRPLAPERTPNAEHERLKIEADQLYRQGNYQQAVELTSQVLAQNSQDDVALYLRGSARVELGLQQRDTKLVRDGVEDSRNALRAGGTTNANYYLPYLHGMTALASLENRAQHAQIVVDVAGDIVKRSGLKAEEKANLLFQRAAAEMFLKEYDAAANDYAQAVRLVPTHLAAHLGLSEAYAAGGKPDRAREAFSRTVVAFPNNAVVFNQRGMFYKNQGDTDAAVADFTRAIEIDPNFVTGYTNRGFSLMHGGDPQAAIGDFSNSLKLNPNQPLVHSLRGTAYLMAGQLALATQDYATVIRMDPNSGIAHADLGFARFFAEDYAGALQQFDRAVAIDSKLTYLDPWRFSATARTSSLEEARRKFSTRLQSSPSNTDWIVNQLRFLAGETTVEQFMASINMQDEAQRLAQTCEAEYFVGRQLLDAGNTAAAMPHFKKAVETDLKNLSAYRGSQLILSGRPATISRSLQ